MSVDLSVKSLDGRVWCGHRGPYEVAAYLCARPVSHSDQIIRCAAGGCGLQYLASDLRGMREPDEEDQMPQCSSDGCGAQIAWARTVPGGKPMPVNRGSANDPAGNLAVWKQDGKLWCRVLKAGEDPAEGQFRGVCHWATCVKARA